ncbi:MAG: hypothetical protein CL773_00535 [Chloroflexi bacterium]|mgnify:FL=1|nr:hypothetical protein [Chloroflexota bacterium]|tara:strand:+ start:815 stop:1567 length:753 start_codon:yes stop_codon:yes gene_type:complete
MYNYLKEKYNINRLRLGTAISFLLLIVLIMGGILSELGVIKNTPSWAPNLFMIVGSLIILFFSDRKLRLLYIAIGTIGFLYEVIGVKFGFLFGAYSYSDVFNLQLFSVPLVMISAWIIIANFTNSFLRNMKKIYFIILGSLLMVITDLVIDPIAVDGLEIWIWENPGQYYGIPNHNFYGWFILSLPIFYLLSFSKNEIHLMSRVVSNLVISFFSIIGIINDIIFPSVLGIFLVLVNLYLYIKNKSKENAI